eukprot:12924155-Prorocentrum_lima.AAC.1
MTDATDWSSLTIARPDEAYGLPSLPTCRCKTRIGAMSVGHELFPRNDVGEDVVRRGSAVQYFRQRTNQTRANF